MRVVATAITACGFVTYSYGQGLNCLYTVATAITACGFVTRCIESAAKPDEQSCNSDYRLRYKKET